MARLIEVEVKFGAGKTFPGKGGKRRQNVVFEPIAGGEDISIWFNEGDDRYCSLKRGERVQLLREGERHTIVTYDDEGDTLEPEPEPKPQLLPKPTHPSNQAQAEAKPTTMDDAHKRVVYEAIRLRAKVISTCHLEVHKLFCNERGELTITEETVQKYAVTVYLDIKSML